MNQFLVKLLLMAVSIYLVGKITKLYRIEGFFTAVITALLLALVNAVIRPILIFLTFPITLLTFGLFLFVVNGISLLIVSKFVSGFKIEGCLNSAVAAVLISVVHFLFDSLLF
jgi:putative membrane protein